MAKDKKGNGRIKNWFTGLKAEFSKIIWLNRATVIKQTAIVIVVTIIIGILITIIDFYSQLGLRQVVDKAMVSETTASQEGEAASQAVTVASTAASGKASTNKTSGKSSAKVDTKKSTNEKTTKKK